ncbi:hypothetical protein Q5M85_18930 [Paraclostridium bifermentans]|nr:hypothetical protein [Paraclostridium bifermentans]
MNFKKQGGIYALGPLIHNKQAVLKYEENGLKTIDSKRSSYIKRA